MNPILTEVLRGEQPESWHRGSVAIVDSGGEERSFGNAHQVLFPRSALKPLQVLPLLEREVDLELNLTRRQIALLSASHSGDRHHVRQVRAILDAADIPVSALQCGAHPPFDPLAQEDLHRTTATPTPLHNNCSGKHAGMLLLARKLKVPLEGYLERDHPVQILIRETILEFTEASTQELAVAIDGCSAPAYGLTLSNLARAFHKLTALEAHAESRRHAIQRLFHAVVHEPHYLSGSQQMDQALIRAGFPRVFAKRGAEAMLAIAVRADSDRANGIGMAIKVDDGANRGYYQPALAMLQQLAAIHTDVPEHLPIGAAGPIHNHRGLEVGANRCHHEFLQWLEHGDHG